MIHSTSQIRVRYAETDKMGFAHHESYVAWFEFSRIELLDSLGTPYREIEANGYYLPVLELNIQYKASCTFDDIITVHCYLKEQPRARIRMEYEIEKEGQTITTAQSLHGFINHAGTPVRPPEYVVAAFEKHFA